MEWIVFSGEQRTGAKALNRADVALEPRRIDNPSHPKFGSYVLQASILTANGYERFGARIAALAKIEAEPDALFMPDDPNLAAPGGASHNVLGRALPA